MQIGIRSTVNFSDDKADANMNNVVNGNVANGNVGARRLQGRDSFRQLQKPIGSKAENLNIDNCYLLKGQKRRWVTTCMKVIFSILQYAKTPDIL